MRQIMTNNKGATKILLTWRIKVDYKQHHIRKKIQPWLLRINQFIPAHIT